MKYIYFVSYHYQGTNIANGYGYNQVQLESEVSKIENVNYMSEQLEEYLNEKYSIKDIIVVVMNYKLMRTE